MAREKGKRKHTLCVTFYAPPTTVEAINRLAKGNRSSYIRRALLVLDQDKDLREAVERKMVEVQDD